MALKESEDVMNKQEKMLHVRVQHLFDRTESLLCDVTDELSCSLKQDVTDHVVEARFELAEKGFFTVTPMTQQLAVAVNQLSEAMFALDNLIAQIKPKKVD